jgi:hypothetical protein
MAPTMTPMKKTDVTITRSSAAAVPSFVFVGGSEGHLLEP